MNMSYLQTYVTTGKHMPPKGYQSLGEELVTAATRLPKSMMDAVDAHIAVLHAQAPWARVNRADALRDLVARGLRQATSDRMPAEEETLLADFAPPGTPAPDPIVKLSHEQEAEEDILTTTPVQPVTFAVTPPEMVEAAAVTLVPELKNAVDQGAPDALHGFDPQVFHLGALCAKHHHWPGARGQSLRYRKGNTCMQCKRQRDSARRPATTQARG
jgi:hypothetical protein